jgi:hypothetical protein
MIKEVNLSYTNAANPAIQALPERLSSHLYIYNEPLGVDEKASDYLLTKMLASDNFDVDPHLYPIAARMLGETARVIQQTTLTPPSHASFFLTGEQAVIWTEGVLQCTLSLKDVTGQPVRMYYLGILADEHGRLIIKRVQKHLLDLNYRNTAHARNSSHFLEKKSGDTLWRDIKDNSGYSPELFGFLAAALTFGPHATNGDILFITPDLQPEIEQRRYMMTSYQGSRDRPEEKKKTIRKIQDEIDMIRERTDFAHMLNAMSVETHQSDRPGYMMTNLSKILQGIHTHWTDDARKDRHELRRILYTLYDMQR